MKKVISCRIMLMLFISVISLFINKAEANSPLYINFTDQSGGLYGLIEEDCNGDLDYEVQPVKVYNTNGSYISISDDHIKTRLFASIKALDAIKDGGYGYYQSNKSLGVDAGYFATIDEIETLSIDLLGLAENPLDDLISSGLTTYVSISGLFADIIIEGGALESAIKIGKIALWLQKIFLDASSSIIQIAENDSIISYQTIKTAYLLHEISMLYGDIAYATFTITINSASLDSVKIAQDGIQAAIPLFGPVWSVINEGEEFWDLVFDLANELRINMSRFLALLDDNIFSLMERQTSFPSNFFFYEPNGNVTGGDNIPPTATFIFSAVDVKIGEIVQVDASSVIDQDGDDISYYWALDGPNGTQTSFEDENAIITNFVPDIPGSYLVKLTLYDGKDYSSVEGGISASAGIVNPLPVSTIGEVPDSVSVNTTVNFDASSSDSPNGEITTYTWNIYRPDGTSYKDSGQSISVLLNYEGTYTIKLIVTDNNDQDSYPASKAITVTGVYPNIVQVYEDDGDLHIYIEDITFSATDCQWKFIDTFTVPPGEKWTEIDFWASQGDVVLLVDDDETPRVDDSDVFHSCKSGYTQDFDSDAEYDWYDGTAKFTWTKDLYPGNELRIAAFSYDGSISNFSINTMVTVSTDLDDDGVPDFEEDSPCRDNPNETFDSDGDNICDNQDKFENDPAASVDSDDDGFPDSWNAGKSQNDSTTGLVLDHPLFINDGTEWADGDGDTVGDNTDKFDNDPAASLDSDGDGFPDAWNTSKTESDSTTGLNLDKFINDSAAAIDDDGDLHPDRWNPGKTQGDSTTGLTLDMFINDPAEWTDSDYDGVGDNSDWAPNDYREWQDSDGDGVGDNADAAPDDPSRSTNVAPLIQDVDPLTVNQNENLEVGIIATDDDNDAITLTIIIAPTFVSLSNGILTVSPLDSTETKDYQIKIKANDDYGGASYKTIFITVMPAPDTDGDGIPDYIENASCTDPFDADTDNDGIIDGIEDESQDGVKDAGETDPCNPDSDYDGIQDGTELGYTLDNVGPDTDRSVFQPDLDPDSMTDPKRADTNGDGILDGEHDTNSNGRVDDGESDPNRSPVKALPFIPILLLE